MLVYLSVEFIAVAKALTYSQFECLNLHEDPSLHVLTKKKEQTFQLGCWNPHRDFFLQPFMLLQMFLGYIPKIGSTVY
jgi:hypothetical protein